MPEPMPDGRESETQAAIACPDCDALYRRRRLPRGTKALCPRCGAVLYRSAPESVDPALALTLTGGLLFTLANSFPFMTLKLEGRYQESTLLTGILELHHHDMTLLALLVFVTSLLMPGAKLMGQLLVLSCVKAGSVPRPVAALYRILREIAPWAMLDVFMLGVLVAFVKLSDMATLLLGPAFYAVAALMVVNAAAASVLEPAMVWDKVDSRPSP